MKPSSAAFCSLAFIFCASTCLNAEPIRDQVFLITEHGSVSGSSPMAQTFTVGITGTLSSVSIPLFGTVPVLLDIRRTTPNGFPVREGDGRGVLGRTVVTPSPVGFELVTADLTSLRIRVRTGDVLAIAASSDGNMNWLIGLDDVAIYDRGEAFLQEPGPEWRRFPEVFHNNFSRADFLFATSVDPSAPIPEPATATLLGTALGALIAVRRRRQKAQGVRPEESLKPVVTDV